MPACNLLQLKGRIKTISALQVQMGFLQAVSSHLCNRNSRLLRGAFFNAAYLDAESSPLPWSDEPIMSLQLEPAKLSPWQRQDSKPHLSGCSIGEPAP